MFTKMPSQAAHSSLASNNSHNTQESIYRSPQMRKEVLRNKYINAQALQTNVNTRTLENLEEIVNEVDTISQEGSLEEKIKDQGEVLLDSEIMTISSNVLKKCTYSLSKNISSYDPVEFADNMKGYLCRLPDSVSTDSDLPDWSLLGKTVMKYFNRTPKLSIVLGTLRPIPKKDIVRRKVTREAQAPTKRPENVIALEKVEDSVEQIVHEIFLIIRNYQKNYKKPLDFFTLVLHPTSFGKTVENILHVSFLVRDGLVKFSTDEDGIPQIQKSNKDEASVAKSNKNTNNIQNVMSLTMKQWKALVEAYQIDKPMIDIKIRNEISK
ncbi:non-structural maintenance of chromosomes element 4 homolog A isoform X1 [Copidosoma floridanum]|uniref:non-structural maintenance of chromosomes element 4 homolog A isoform X1 n=2 Tax=Copidosoma floridanum TaxID=29053 RepID=UPI0006C99BEF|nr:non-structural maintenance of chromosomes element 4 homolog A isoform X1 [Copidosoma floridanum]